MKLRLAPVILVSFASVALLAGCTAGPTITVTADQIATAAEGALEQQVGSRPTLECGDADVTLVKGTKVDCVLTDPETGEQFDAPVTITKVDGTDYAISVQVADEPIK